MFTRIFWLVLGAVIAFWVFRNDPELTFLVTFREWLLGFLQEFQKDPSEAVNQLIYKHL